MSLIKQSTQLLSFDFLVEDVQCLFERIVKHLSDKVHKPEVVSAIITLNAALKIHGGEIEANNKINMDKHQVIGTEGKFSLMKYQNKIQSLILMP